MAKKTPAKTEVIVPFKPVNDLLTKFDSFKKFRSSKMFYVVLIALGLLLLIVYKKNLIIAAMVNNSPVSNLELQTRLNEQFRTQTLNSLINEKIILSEAARNNVVVTAGDIDKKIAEIEANIGGAATFDQLLSQQGQTRASIRQQIKLQAIIEKLYEKEATVSAEEVTEFVEQNGGQLQATDSAGQQKEAYGIIQNQKLSQIFSQKFQELKAKAKVNIF